MNRTLLIILTFTSLLIANPCFAQIPTARVGDVTHLQGQGTNVIIGIGLVTGLNGTGDGGKYRPALEQMRVYLERFGTSVDSLDELAAAKNVAIVSVEVTIPEHGAREGEMLNVNVTAHGAKSLEGGRLLPTPLVYHDRNVDDLFGFASGALEVRVEKPTSATIRAGARIEKNITMTVLASGSELTEAGFSNPWIQAHETYITLVLDETHAGWSMAAAVAQAVDKELGTSANAGRVALALDSKNVVVNIPAHQRGDPASWIRDVERTPILMESNEARVTINRNTGTIVVTGDTRLSPVIVSQRGMTITIANPQADTPARQPAFERQDFVALDVAKKRSSNLTDLLEALNRLKIPIDDRIAILEEIHRAGKLHAKLIYEG